MSASTDAAPTARRSGSGRGKEPRPPCCQPMTADEPTPREGESADGASCVDAELLKSLRRDEIRAKSDHIGDQLIAFHREVRGKSDEEILDELREFQAQLTLLVELAERNAEGEVPE